MSEAGTWPWQGLDTGRIAGLLEDVFPAAGERLETVGEGDFCLAFRLGPEIIRVAKHPRAALAHRREACVLKRISGMLPLPVPRLEYRAPAACPPFTIHREITGTVMTREAWERLPGPAREATARELAEFLRALHAVPLEIGAACGVPRLDGSAMAAELRKEVPGILPLFDPASRTRLEQFLIEWPDSSGERERSPALLHCDLAPGHLLYHPAPARLSGIIDFGDVAMGDPARDFIYLYEDFGPDMLDRVVSWYAGEASAGLTAAVRRWHLLEAVAWTIDMAATERAVSLHHGLGEITRELAFQFT